MLSWPPNSHHDRVIPSPLPRPNFRLAHFKDQVKGQGMNLLNQNPRLLVVTLTVSFFLSLGANPQAQKKSQMPSRTGHVNDFAGVVDENTKQRLENILQNLKLKSGIQLDLATVESTGGRDIFDFSRQLAREWHVGDRNSSKRSLLLVLSVNDKAIFTQFSKS